MAATVEVRALATPTPVATGRPDVVMITLVGPGRHTIAKRTPRRSCRRSWRRSSRNRNRMRKKRVL
jgi:hypothetical protein